MPALLHTTAPIELKPAKPHGLNELGVPLSDDTVVKKGKLGEFEQTLDSGRIGRRFQNVKITAVKTAEGGETSSKVMVSFEVFGDDNAPVVGNQGVAAMLHAGDKVLADISLGTLFLPYACAWYENRFAFDIANDLFDALDKLSLVARADEVRMLA
jgi:hypothetical protein